MLTTPSRSGFRLKKKPTKLKNYKIFNYLHYFRHKQSESFQQNRTKYRVDFATWLRANSEKPSDLLLTNWH